MNDWQKETPRVLSRLAQVFSDIAGAVMVGMMLMTVYDVVGRSVGLGSVEPVIELTTMGVVIVASFGIAITTIRAGHVIIDLFTRNNKIYTNRLMDAFWLLVMALMLGFMAYLAMHEGIALHGFGTTTEILKWSVLAYYIPPVFGWSLAAITAVSIAAAVLFARKPIEH